MSEAEKVEPRCVIPEDECEDIVTGLRVPTLSRERYNEIDDHPLRLAIGQGDQLRLAAAREICRLRKLVGESACDGVANFESLEDLAVAYLKRKGVTRFDPLYELKIKTPSSVN